ncbi:MAG: glycosyltransferase [Deltaproteobacteria bacterium]|nr:glycosyltransferase [Deltaproteobacteria bacterium]
MDVKKEKVKVLFLIWRYTGDYNLINDMVLGINPEEYAVRVCYLTGSFDGKNSLDKKCHVFYLEDETKEYIAKSKVKMIRALLEALKKDKPDIIHCHRHKPTLIGTVAAFFARIPYIVSHVHGLNRTRGGLRRIINSIIFRKVAKVIAVSKGVRVDVLQTNPSLATVKAIAVWNGVDIKRIERGPEVRAGARKALALNTDTIAFGTVGRLVPTKGHNILINAFKDVSVQLPTAKLIIAGDGSLRAELTKQAEELGLSEKIKFIGFTRNVPELLHALDVFVFPSLAEGLPLGLLEAMVAKLPVVASRVGGIPEVVSDGFARLVEAEDAVALAKAMVAYGSLSEEKRATMGADAKMRVQKDFSKEMMCARIEKVYEEIME